MHNFYSFQKIFPAANKLFLKINHTEPTILKKNYTFFEHFPFK